MVSTLIARIGALGDAAVVLPAGIGYACWVATYDRELACAWCRSILLAIASVVLSKIIWTIFGLTSPIGDFRMVSGHMLLAFAVWPVVVAATSEMLHRGAGVYGRLFAYAACLVLGESRLLGAHSLSETLMGALMGLVIESQFSSRFLRVSRFFRERFLLLSILTLSSAVICLQIIWRLDWLDASARLLLACTKNFYSPYFVGLLSAFGLPR